MKSKIALVTGSSRGIGRAIATTLAADGFDVIVHYHQSAAAARAVAKHITHLGQKAWVLQADLTQDSAIKKMFATISRRWPKIDLLVNNAGFDYGLLLEDYSMAQIRHVINSILISKISTTKYALPLLKKSLSPAIINIASRTGGPTTIKTVSAYAPAQAGVIKFTQCCALEFSPYRIRVNCVAPGLTQTDLTTRLLTPQDFKIAAGKNPSGRVAQPQDVANAVSFLASDKSSYINGSTLLVTGGSELV